MEPPKWLGNLKQDTASLAEQVHEDRVRMREALEEEGALVQAIVDIASELVTLNMTLESVERILDRLVAATQGHK